MAKKLIPIPVLKKKAEKVFNAFIRQRDSSDGYFNCISCGKTKYIKQCNAGHYVPVSKSQLLRYHELNVHAECVSCNGFDEFHLIGYRKNLINKIGQDAVEWLESKAYETHKHTREELEFIIKNYSL